MAVQNALTGGKFVKKWLQVIKCDGLGYLFHHKNIQFGQFYIKNQNVKFHFAVDLRMQPPTTPPPPPPRLLGFADKIIFFEKLSVQNNISGFLWLF